MRAPLFRLVAPVVFAAVIVSPRLGAQGSAPTSTLTKDEIAALAKVQVAISVVHDSVNAEMAQARNKKAENQAALHEKMTQQVADVLKKNGMSEADYERKTFIVSTVPDVRHTFDSVVAKLTGAPLPGQLAAAPPSRTAIPNLPTGPVFIHVGHVTNGFADTPKGEGLLAVAENDAGVAAQHAQLAGRQPTNLDYMKLHAGHVLNALDPTLVPMGPGSGYGVKKATMGVAMHIELAAKAQGASPNVQMHSNHVATAARNTLTRVDQLIAIAQKVQASTDAAAAAALVNQMIPLAQQLMAGADTNNDGRVGWEEGGLQTAEEHVKLLVASEAKPPL
jgi:hypothetical protein